MCAKLPAVTGLLLPLMAWIVLVPGTAHTATQRDESRTIEDKYPNMLAVEHVTQDALQDQDKLAPQWAVNLKSKRVSRFYNPDSLAELDYEYLLVLTNENELMAVERKSGETKWITKLTGRPTGEVCFTKFGIYLVERSYLVYLERHSGQVVWRIPLPLAAAAGPVVREEEKGEQAIYVPALDRKVYCLEVYKTQWPAAVNIGALTQNDFVMDKYVLRIVWRFPAEAQIAGELVYQDQRLFLTDTEHSVYSISTDELNMGKPQKILRFRTQGAMEAGPAVIGPYLLVSSRDRSLYCLGNRGMNEVWRYPTGHLLQDSAYPVIDPNTNETTVVIRCGLKGPLTGLLDVKGTVRWELEDGGEVVAQFQEPENEISLRGIMILHNRDDSLSANYISSGKQLWRIPAKALGPFCRNTRDPLIYTAALEGQYLCALKKGD